MGQEATLLVTKKESPEDRFQSGSRVIIIGREFHIPSAPDAQNQQVIYSAIKRSLDMALTSLIQQCGRTLVPDRPLPATERNLHAIFYRIGIRVNVPRIDYINFMKYSSNQVPVPHTSLSLERGGRPHAERLQRGVCPRLVL